MDVERIMTTIAEELGVELDTWFEVERSKGGKLSDSPYMITTEGLYDCNAMAKMNMLGYLVEGTIRVQRPLSFEELDEYYTIDLSSPLGVVSRIWTGNQKDVFLLSRGLAFKTYDEAKRAAIRMGVKIFE